jgi:3-oxoacyl-[acyl-carrier protein] reductase
MELKLKNQLFITGGASSGFGNAIATALLNEGAHVIAIARGKQKLEELKAAYPEQLELLVADITLDQTVQEIRQLVKNRKLHGILVNAGGPPAMTVMETKLEDWDQAYRTVLRWKVNLVQSMLPLMLGNNYGRILFIESAAVKQPMENLVLSNAFRLAVVGFIKTLSQEIAANGVTINALAPGFHNTAALDRLVNKKIEQRSITREQAFEEFVKGIPVGFLGSPEDFASLALWMLSESSRFITGQTISVDGGVIRGVMG